MTSGDLLRQLFSSFSDRDDSAFRSAAESIINDERLKNHRILADDLERILYMRDGRSRSRKRSFTDAEIPRDRDRGVPLADLAIFDYGWDRIVLPPRVQDILKQLELEHHRRDILEAHGLRPKERILFYGPPGVGKTLAAQVLASALDLPLLTVRFDGIVSSYLGETAANLRRIFDFAESGRYAVLFDEFDAIGKDRDNRFEHGELKRVVNTLLQLMDSFQGEGLFIAATNHEVLLDNAVWRRFEVVSRFSRPTQQERILMFRRFLQSFERDNVNLPAIAKRITGATGADIEQICVEAARYCVLGGRTSITDDDIEHGIQLFRTRLVAFKSTNGSSECCDSEVSDSGT